MFHKTVSEIVDERDSITPEMPVHLEMTFGKSAQSWLSHQAAHDLWHLEPHSAEFGVERVIAHSAGGTSCARCKSLEAHQVCRFQLLKPSLIKN